MSYLVSIVVPIYNVAAYIERCLESLAKQTYKDIEVIFVDDCGTDNSMKIVKEYLDNHPFPTFRIVQHEKNGGLSAARNSGLKVATGEYVYFFDSDDEITPDCISSLAAPLQTENFDMIVGSYREQHIDTGKSEDFVLQQRTVTNAMQSYANGEWYVMAWNKLCRRDFLMKNNLFFEEGLLHEDVVWTFKVASCTKSMFLIDDITYTYYIRSGSIMTTMSLEKDVDIHLKVFTKIKNYIDEHRLSSNPNVYKYVEAKKSAVLHSLLEMGEVALYSQYYPRFYRIRTISPISGYRQHIVPKKDLLRDFHYCLPPFFGKYYKRILFFFFYTLRGRKIEGAIWKNE